MKQDQATKEIEQRLKQEIEKQKLNETLCRPITKSGLCVSVLLKTIDIPITIQRGRKLGYVLPVKTRYEMTENVKENHVLDCPNTKKRYIRSCEIT